MALSPCYAPRVAKNEKISKTRADVALVERGLADSRTRAQALILAGLVFSGEQRVNKAGDTVAADAPLELRGQDHPWVSRGGLKLDHALEELGIDVTGAVGNRCRGVHGGLHRCAADPRRKTGLRGGCGAWPVRVEAAQR